MKYDPLRKFLTRVPKTNKFVTLTFSEIEKLIQAGLPRSASEHQAWWGNHTKNFQASSWLGAGFFVDSVDYSRKIVCFRRNIQPAEQENKLVAFSVPKAEAEGASSCAPQVEAKAPLPVSQLITAGFQVCGYWALKEQGGIQFVGDIPKAPGIYAYAIDDKVQYLGIASLSLKKRIYFYGKPGPTQKTNIRLNALITKELGKGKAVDLLAATPGQTVWNGLPVDIWAGLEAAMIKEFYLPWNIRGVAG